MSDFVLKALDYGVLGLCAVMVVLAVRLLYKEQAREGEPRSGLVWLIYGFLGFCLVLAGVNAYVQLSQSPKPTLSEEEISQLQERLQSNEKRFSLLRSKLEDIEEALSDKEYNELRSLVAQNDPVARERLQRTIDRLKQRLVQAKKLTEER